MILVVENDNLTREQLVRTVRWVDARHRVESADNVWDGMRIAGRLRPTMIVLGPNLGTAVNEMAQKIRERLPGALLVAVGKTVLSSPDSPVIVDARLENPMDHARLDALISQRRGRKFYDAEGNVAQRTRKKRATPQPGPMQMKVVVRLTSEQDTMKFNVSTPEGATIGMLLQQLGKSAIEWYRLYRNADELNVNLETPLQDGDELYLRTEPAPLNASLR